MTFMVRKTFHLAALFIVAVSFSAAPIRTQSRPVNTVVLYEGERIIPGDGSQLIASAAMLVENGIITRIGQKGSFPVPRGAQRVDLTGKTIMPALINAHGHPGFQQGLTYTAANFTRETIIE